MLEGWEAPDVVGLVALAGLIYFILSACCFRKPTTADRIASLRTFFAVVRKPDSNQGNGTFLSGSRLLWIKAYSTFES